MAIKENAGVGDRLFITLVYVFLVVVLIVVLYPLIFVVSASFSSPLSVIEGQVILWPVHPTLLGYQSIFKSAQFMSGFWNSTVYTVVGTTISVTLTCLAAYPLSRRDLPGRAFLMLFVAFTMLFSGGLVPYYLVVKDLGMIDTMWAMVIPSAIAAYFVIIARTFFQHSISDELRESANIDGSSEFGVFIRIVLPLSKPIIVVLILMYAVANWNSFFNGLIFLNTPSKFPLQIDLYNILEQNTSDPNMISRISAQNLETMEFLPALLQYGVIVVSTLPFLVIYPFIQRYLVKGVMIGSLKG